jgi:GalNAc-alpha-(1->4)-GalNAc-alpha-(1->3)-diNAcBac-PP-undecaprenol alpha-1,4-N-acetyl-D-galactosaminyltransferase
MPGYVSDPASVLREADLFVLASRYEGFPNALLEAMAVGLPVISTDCPYGPSHIVRNDVDGLLVPIDDAEALATAMAALMDDEPRRRRLGRRATEVTERFAVDRIMAMWESLVYDSVAHRLSAGRRVGA